MDINTIVVILGAVGGLEGIKQFLHWWNNRRNEERKSDAEADALIEENNRKSVEWLEKRLEQRDMKIDGLYAELRKEQAEKLELLHKYHQLDIEHTLKRCEVKNCGGRKPPSGY